MISSFVSTFLKEDPFLSLSDVLSEALPTFIGHTLQDSKQSFIWIVPEDADLKALSETLSFFLKNHKILMFPPWDTLPYDRVSPLKDIMVERIKTLLEFNTLKSPFILLLPLSSAIQKINNPHGYTRYTETLKKGSVLNFSSWFEFLISLGYRRVETVRDNAEFAVRGGIVDLFVPGEENPFRLDFFGSKLENIRTFDVLTQRTLESKVFEIKLYPTSEVILTPDNISRFKQRFREAFGIQSSQNDPLYLNVSEGKFYPGIEAWLPFFAEKLTTVFDLLPEAWILFEDKCFQNTRYLYEHIQNYYESRLTEPQESYVYHPIEPQELYLKSEDFEKQINARIRRSFSSFGTPQSTSVKDFLKPLKGVLPFDYQTLALEQKIEKIFEIGKTQPVLICAFSEGSLARLQKIIEDYQGTARPIQNYEEVLLEKKGLFLTLLPLAQGFLFHSLFILTESDFLGEKIQKRRALKKADQFIAEASALEKGDYVVHFEHGIGQYDGLENLNISGAAHDCLKVVYLGGDKLFVPVENIDVLTRYGASHTQAQVDKLGSAAWQNRKAKLKNKLKDMAERLLQIAAERALEKGEVIVPPESFDEFCARFPYVETDDQLKAIEEVLYDLGSGQPMDRLICGDVGFGKTEVALRAAFVAAASHMQVAIVVPTTLLARQHYKNFKERFQGLPFRVEQLSRFVNKKDADKIKEDIREGHVHITIGTHGLLSDSLKFKNLGLLIVDEEQHFGVGHKERLKKFKSHVHVLSMSATPIPRTLQISLLGLRSLSLITTPPTDRLAVQTFIMPYDGLVIREAINREKARGGQVFYVCPRLHDLPKIQEKLEKLLPDLKIAYAHGQIPAATLEKTMLDFDDGKYDLLLSTNIIESGLDVPRANTLIVHRTDLFGLGQLYQLKGRVGRGKAKGYAYFTTPENNKLSKLAEKRLEVLQSLSHLGAGFSLASYDLDIRGAGNILGEEQSGHIREVGIELYQNLLSEAIIKAKESSSKDHDLTLWSPQIHLGLTVLIPESYVADLSVRLTLYRRIASLETREEIDSMAAEMIDRFGPLPDPVSNLFEMILCKQMCFKASIEKIDIGPKGIVLSFYQNQCPYTEKLVEFITKQAGTVKIRPDNKLVFLRSSQNAKDRVNLIKHILSQLISLTTPA
jgi:transcription-repair coupling factor (superfamily II helicase)